MSTFLIANDSYKNCLSARQVADNISKGILKVSDRHKTLIVPLADGGEGSLEAINSVMDLQRIEITVHQSDGQWVNTYYLFDNKTKIAYIEMASIVGLELVKEEDRDLSTASSYGLGEAMSHAMDKGAKGINIFVGGSATNDMGLGMAQALGVKFYGKHLSSHLSGRDLTLIDDYELPDLSGFPSMRVITDVHNPLYGNAGASFVYGAQKGGGIEELKKMDAGMRKIAAMIKRKIGINLQNIKGSGAAGGVAAGLIGFFNAEIIGGANYVLQLLGVEDKISQADVIITGEGKLDVQTADGKLVSALAKIAKQHRKPLIAVCGRVELQYERLPEGISETYSLAHRNNFASYDAVSTMKDLIEIGEEIGMKYLK